MSLNFITDEDNTFEYEVQQAKNSGYFVTAEFQDHSIYRNKPTKNRRAMATQRKLKRQGYLA